MKRSGLENRPGSPERAKNRQARFFLPLAVVLAVTLGGLYLLFAWGRYQHMAKEEALQLAESVEALLHASDRSELAGDGTAGATLLAGPPPYVHPKNWTVARRSRELDVAARRAAVGGEDL